MSSTPKSIGDESLAESWVDVAMSTSSASASGRVTPVIVPSVGLLSSGASSIVGEGSQPGPLSAQMTEGYFKLLRDAQRDSNCPSSRVSLASSRRDSRCDSPKSPPNSPNNEVATGDNEEELKGIFINKDAAADHTKEWMMSVWGSASKGEAKLSLRRAKCGGKGLFSREVILTLFLSNVISLLIGTGIGLWINKRPSSIMTHIPLN
jgi:BCL2/adenovirus E1B protein-interacting protein 3